MTSIVFFTLRFIKFVHFISLGLFFGH